MSEERLTVAELLARAEKRGDRPARSDRPRRRRRSLEDGGVSVAELTGSIPKVRADGPRRGAHAAPDELEDTAGEVRAEEVAEAPATDVADTDVADTDVPVAEETAEVAEAPESELEAVADDEPVAETPAVPESGLEAVADDEPAAEADEDVDEYGATDADRAPLAVPAAVPLDPRPVMANDERGEVTFTFTKLHDADTGSWPVAEAGPVAREVLEGSQSHDDRPTTVLPVIDEPATETAPLVRDPEPEPAGALADYDEPAADYDEPDYRDDGYRSAGVDEWGAAGDFSDDTDHWDTAAVPAAAGPAAVVDDREVDEYAARARADEEFSRTRGDWADEEGADEGGDARDGATPDSGKPAPAKKKLRRTRKGQLEDDSLSVGLLIVQTIVGLVLGALAFVLFNFLWSSLPVAVCVVIALVFTFLLVVGVNMVRREKDGITPVLAGLVGLVVSFSPWLLTMV